MSADAQSPALARWVQDFAARKLPVLRATVQSLQRLQQDGDAVKRRDIVQTILRDPMLTLLVLRYLRTHHSRRMLEDITTAEHAVMMLGLQRFFSAFGTLPAVEDQLGAQPAALAGFLQVVARARSAATYAGALAALRADLVSDEVVAAALLHDMAELLLWCFAPDSAAAIAARLRASPGLRSAEAQRAVLGFTLLELQLALVRHWGLPELLLSLMDDAHAERPRVRNVALAVSLARHAANGWDDPALPDDLEDISKLVSLPLADVRAHVFEAALRAMTSRGWQDDGAAPGCLPPVPREPDGKGDPAPAALEAAVACLRSIAKGAPRRGQPRGGLARDPHVEQLAALAAMLDGISAGLGFASALLLVPDAAGANWRPRYVAGRALAPGDFVQDAATAKAIADAVAARVPAVQIARTDDGRTEGQFILPVLQGERVAALVLALRPADTMRLALANFKRFKDLGEELARALQSLGANAGWLGDGG